MIEIVLKQRFGLFLVGIHKGAGDFLFEDLQILLVQRVLQKFEVLLARIVGKVCLFHHIDQGLAHIDRVDTITRGVI